MTTPTSTPNVGRALSLRARIILLVLAVAMLPLGLVGWWLARTAASSGEELLRIRLADALERTVADIGPRWVGQRSALLSVAEHASIQRTLAGTDSPSREMPTDLRQLVASLDPAVEAVDVRDQAGRTIWSVDRSRPGAESDALGNAALPVRIDIFERVSGRRIGRLDARVRLISLVGTKQNAPFVGGAVLAILDQDGGSLVSTPFDPSNLAMRRFHWAGEGWLAERRSLAEPRLDLVAAAPLDPFTQPFERAAQRGLWVLLGAAVAGLLVASAITARMTRRLSRLASAADAVARGELTRKTDVTGSDEVARVAHAFNTMTDSLGHTLGELSQRESLAAVGSFASELAHEVRNPLTAIRVDLQVVEEQLPSGSPLREIQRGALDEIVRLDGTVSGVLQLARSGKITLAPVDLTSVLASAVRAARPEFDRRQATLESDIGAEPAIVHGDANALRQLTLNLLLNAAQAVAPGGRATIRQEIEGEHVAITVSDDGPGMTADILAKVREPFFSTKAGGTGLGLAIADRIARAHGGALEIQSALTAGTVVRVRVARVGEDLHSVTSLNEPLLRRRAPIASQTS